MKRVPVKVFFENKCYGKVSIRVFSIFVLTRPHFHRLFSRFHRVLKSYLYSPGPIGHWRCKKKQKKLDNKKYVIKFHHLMKLGEMIFITCLSITFNAAFSLFWMRWISFLGVNTAGWRYLFRILVPRETQVSSILVIITVAIIIGVSIIVTIETVRVAIFVAIVEINFSWFLEGRVLTARGTGRWDYHLKDTKLF